MDDLQFLYFFIFYFYYGVDGERNLNHENSKKVLSKSFA